MLNHNSSEQDTSFIPTSSTTGSNDGLALIARGLFDTFQYHSDGSTPSTNNEAPPPSDDARSANVAPEVDETKPTSLSSIEATSTAQVESQSSVATLSTVDVSRPSPNQPNAEQNWYRFRDW